MSDEIAANDEPRPIRPRSRLWIAAFLLLWAAVLAAPYLFLFFVGRPAAVVAGVALPVAWVSIMPSTCRSGGFGVSVLAMWQVVSGLVWLVAGLVYLVRWITFA